MLSDDNWKEPEINHRYQLNEKDEERIAYAVEQGIKSSGLVKPESLKLKPFLAALIIFLIAAIMGFYGFSYRPSQNATFRGIFASDTYLKIDTDPDTAHEIWAKSLNYLYVWSQGNPIVLKLPMEDEESKKLAEELNTEWTGDSVESPDLFWELNFTSPVNIRNDMQKISEVIIERKPEKERFLFLSTKAEGSSNSTVIVEPAKSQFQVKPSGFLLDEDFSLRKGLSSSSTVNSPYFVLSLTEPGGTPGVMNSEVKTEHPGDVEIDGKITGDQVEIQDASDGILTMGSVTYKLSKGEYLKLEFERPVLIRIDRGRISIDDATVTATLLNGVIELLPRWYTLWHDWAKSLWTAVAIGSGVPTFLGILRRLNLWPS